MATDLPYGLPIVVLAALAHDNLRGIRLGLGQLLQYLETGQASSVSLHLVDRSSVLVTVSAPAGAAHFVLKRFPEQVAAPYVREEYGSFAVDTITHGPPGRALAPLHSSAFRERARLIIEKLCAGDREGLLALPPMMMVMGITDYCNQKCPFCFRQRDPAYEVTTGDIFTNDNLTTLFLNLAEGGVQSLRLCGEGEDTIHPQYMKFILMARVAGMNLMQITNGTRLENLAPLMARCIDFLRVSINGWTEEDYAQKHGVSSTRTFHSVINGLKKVVQEKQQLTSRIPTICISTVLTPADCRRYRPEDFHRLIDYTGADLAILKQDLECSRVQGEGLVRLRVHAEKHASMAATESTSGKQRCLPSPTEGRAGDAEVFKRFVQECRVLCPDAFSDRKYLAASPLPRQRDWISELGLGCILRYIRAEVERLELYNCSQLHDFYGDLRFLSLREAWHSPAREAGIAQDVKRPAVLCPTCGWGDFFRIMNFFLNEAVQKHPAYEELVDRRRFS